MVSFFQEFPGNMSSQDTLRLYISAKTVLKQDLQPKNNSGHIEVGSELYSWNLVAPTDIQENIQHTWEEYGSFQGRASQLKSDAFSSLAAASQITTAADGRAGGNTNPARAKVDSPIVYTGSKRLEYSITIPFMRYLGGSYKDVFEPIHNFRKLSCAGISNQIDTVDFPAIFEIYTSPADFVYIKYAALLDVQTKYEAPFVGGYPQRAECTLTFMDIQPLYRESWRDGNGLITTSI